MVQQSLLLDRSSTLELRSRLLVFHAGIAWQLLGMLDLVTAVTLGVPSSPPPVGILGYGITTQAMNMLPLSDIPTFAVPSLLTLHIISIAQAASRQADVGTQANPARPQVQFG